jgi:hypothetical protein
MRKIEEKIQSQKNIGHDKMKKEKNGWAKKWPKFLPIYY